MADQPSNAPTDLKDGVTPNDVGEDATATAILSDDRLEGNPGGGGLRGSGSGGGGSGGDDAAGGGIARTGGLSPNTPADGGVTAGDANASAEAIRRSTDETTR